jgi:hypothetical protein
VRILPFCYDDTYHVSVVQLLVPHAPVILELVQKVLADENSGEPLDKLAFGVIGDLADAYPNGEIKPLLLAEWIASSLVLRKGYDKETKTTVKWAREVRRRLFLSRSGWCMLTFMTPCRWSSAQPHED